MRERVGTSSLPKSIVSTEIQQTSKCKTTPTSKLSRESIFHSPFTQPLPVVKKELQQNKKGTIILLYITKYFFFFLNSICMLMKNYSNEIFCVHLPWSWNQRVGESVPSWKSLATSSSSPWNLSSLQPLTTPPPTQYPCFLLLPLLSTSVVREFFFLPLFHFLSFRH